MADDGSGRMRRINRSVVIVSPKVPFLEWAQQAYGDRQPPPGLANQPRSFLIPLAADDQEAFDYVQVVCESVFSEMLAAWNPDPSSWPKELDSSSLFTAWFDVQPIPIVHDQVADEPLGPA